MLRIAQTGNSLPFSWPRDPSSEFQPGMVAQLYARGNQIVCGASDGTVPIGIIDDIKTNSFTSTSVNEVIIVPAMGIKNGNGQLVTPIDIMKQLNNPNVLPTSFISYDVDVELIARNGVLVFVAGTPLNFSMNGTGTPDAIRTVVSYTFSVPNIPGDDSTAGSGRVTVWFERMIASTNQFDTSAQYPLNANLFVNERGLMTTRQLGNNYPSIAICTAPPTTINGSLEFMLI